MKSIFKSKTFWINLLGGIVGASTLANGTVPPKFAPGVVAAGGIANILLRVITDTSVSVP